MYLLRDAAIGLLIVTAFATVVTIPGWIAAAVWGWHYFLAAIAAVWISSVGLWLFVMLLAWIGNPDG